MTRRTGERFAGLALARILIGTKLLGRSFQYAQSQDGG